MILDSNKYFLYRHIRLDKNEPFYIGIGTKKENFEDCKTEYKRAYEKTNRTKHWRNIVNINPDYKVEILLESNDYKFILQKEIEFIALYGRKDLGKGSLCNLTDGGEGSVGLKVTEETKKKISGRNHWNYGRKLSEEHKRKLKEGKKKYVITEEIKAKMKKPKPPRTKEHIENLKLSATGKNAKPLVRKYNNKITYYNSPKEASEITGYRKHLIYLWCGKYQKPKDGSTWEYIPKIRINE